MRPAVRMSPKRPFLLLDGCQAQDREQDVVAVSGGDDQRPLLM